MSAGQYRAFTLIELLVVIALIAILAAILFPAVAGVQNRSRQIKCLSNAKQIAMAGVLQLGELKNKLPTRSAANQSGEAAEQLLPYLRNIKEVFDCPSKRGTADATMKFPSYAYYTDYELNNNLCVVGASVRNQNCIRDASMAAFDFDYPSANPGLAHKTGVNLGYLDGHAAWLELADLGGSAFKTNGLILP